MNKYLEDLFLFNFKVKNIIDQVLESNLFSANLLYRYWLNRQIKKIVLLYKGKPYCLRIENTNLCNAKCYLCPHSSMKRKKGIMSKNLYTKIIDEAVKLGIKYVNLHNFGEPLLDKDFVWRLKYAKEKGIKKVCTNTNGQLLEGKLAKDLIDSGLDELFVSLDAATEATYKKLRIGLNFQKVKNNVINLSRMKKKLKTDHPKVVVDFLESELNIFERDKFINDWDKIADRVCISRIHDWAGKKIDLVLKKSRSYVSQSSTPCRLPFTELVIGWDGRALLCCLDVEGEEIVGDAKKEHLWEIWSGRRLQAIRRKQMALRTDELKLCRNCQNRLFWWL